MIKIMTVAKMNNYIIVRISWKIENKLNKTKVLNLQVKIFIKDKIL